MAGGTADHAGWAAALLGLGDHDGADAARHLALRQTEGLIGSIIELLRLDLAVPDNSTLSRRARTLRVPLGSEPAGCICSWTAPG